MAETIKHAQTDREPVVYLSGRIDSSNAADIQQELSEKLRGSDGQTLEINMRDVEYVSSAGLRVFMKLMKDGANLKITEVSSEVYEIFSVTGFTELLDIKKAYRTMSVDGCKVIGSGFSGTIYRVDDDTIVKVYDAPDSIPMIENEKRRAKQAFLAGIPTAISFDIVKVGDKYGAVFELLKAKTLNDILIDEPERADEIIKYFVDFVKQVHATEVTPGSLPYSPHKYIRYLASIRRYLTDEQYEKLKIFFEGFPQNDHVVHGDFHMKNTMLVDGEPMLIDMDTLSAGAPIFDIAGMYVTYMAFKEDEPGNSMKFLGISDEMTDRIWYGIMDNYFADATDDVKSAINDRIRLVAAVRFLHILEGAGMTESELGQKRVRHTQENISKLLEKVDLS